MWGSDRVRSVDMRNSEGVDIMLWWVSNLPLTRIDATRGECMCIGRRRTGDM
jgi:hypothetical protein